KVGSLLCEAGESVMAYGASGHRHLPEISQELDRIAGCDVGLTFVPHLMPMIRGIHATVYADLKEGQDVDLQALYEERYKDEPFVDVLPAGSHPTTRSVRGVNMCRISLHRPQNANKIVVLSVIDNLVKGASGQAIQNMNLMFGFEENTGLNQVGLMP
ncbi:MAG: Asd/ArgC dimerization domain-containing protein, partial [Oceanospirillum sp.]|nr:Asd/ArgC dimerization domain-containing protein [Oceanospirillum sp.]